MLLYVYCPFAPVRQQFKAYPIAKGVLKGVQTPPKFSDLFWNSEGKEIERKKGMLGEGGLPLNIFLGLIFFRVGLRYFQGGVEKFSRGLNFRGGGGGGGG